MKTKAWLITLMASLGAGAVLAQDTNLTPPAAAPAAAPITAPAPADAPALAPAPAEAPADQAKPAPAKPKKKAVKKLAVKSSGLAAAHTLLDPAVPATVKVDSLNVRGLPSLSGEVVAKLHKGETVTMVEEITLDKVREGEPAKWARVSLPTNTPVWVSAHLVDSNTMTVTANRLNVRGGPGENYNVLGRLEKGTVVKEIKKHEGWMQIETPANVTGFVAADFLEKQTPTTPAPAAPIASALTAATTPAAPVPTAPAPTVPTPAPATITPSAPAATVPPPAEVVNVQPDTNSVVMPPIDSTPAPAAPAEAATTPAAATPAPATIVPEPVPAPAPAATAPVAATPEPAAVDSVPELNTNKDIILTKRVVTREGVVRQARNIQAPTYFELRDTKTGELMDYLNPTKSEIELKSYIGQKVIVSGEETMDRRWKYTPVIEIETIDPI